jgi:hypothetical protein
MSFIYVFYNTIWAKMIAVICISEVPPISRTDLQQMNWDTEEMRAVQEPGPRQHGQKSPYLEYIEGKATCFPAVQVEIAPASTYR